MPSNMTPFLNHALQENTFTDTLISSIGGDFVRIYD